jgi:Flp pilus assembly protein CpaB
MWKVKRMNTARIVVLAIAVGAGGIAACLASGSDNGPAAAVRGVFISLTLRSIADNAPEINTDERAPKRGESVDVVRYGVNSPTTTQT